QRAECRGAKHGELHARPHRLRPGVRQDPGSEPRRVGGSVARPDLEALDVAAKPARSPIPERRPQVTSPRYWMAAGLCLLCAAQAQQTAIAPQRPPAPAIFRWYTPPIVP